jgi:hypothetical protein
MADATFERPPSSGEPGPSRASPSAVRSLPQKIAAHEPGVTYQRGVHGMSVPLTGNLCLFNEGST